MARPRRTLRIIHPARDPQIDDQLWPLVVALTLLGSLIVGGVLAYLRLDDPRWYANAWTWLIAIPVFLGATLLALAWTGNRLLRRTMQLAIVLGVTIHVILLLVALQTDVFRRAWIEMLAAASRPPVEKSVVVPDYLSWQHDPQRRAARDVQQPVEVRPPDPEPDRERVRPEPVPPVPPRAEIQPRPVLEPQDAPRPNIVKRAEPNQSVPRQRDEASQLSRRVATMPPRSNQAAVQADTVVRPEQRDEPARPRPDDAGVWAQRMLNPAPAEPTRTSDAPSEPTVAREQGRRPQEPTPTTEASPGTATARRDQRPPVVPRAEADEQRRPTAPARSGSEEVQPRAVVAAKQETRAPDTRPEIETPPRETVPPPVFARREPQQPAPTRDELAQTPRSAFNRQARVTTRPDVAPLTDASTQAAAGANPAAQPLDVRVATAPTLPPAEAAALGPVPQRVSPSAKSATAVDPPRPQAGPQAASAAAPDAPAAGNLADQLPQLSAPTSGASMAQQTAARQTQRPTLPGEPSLDPAPEPQVPRRRTEREAAVATSPTPAESPTRIADRARQTEMAAAAAMALSKSELGMAGRGVSENLGRAEPSGDSPAAVPSGAAQRADPSQRADEGPALAPQDAALVRQMRAGRLRPDAVLPVTPPSPPVLAGSRQPAELNAVASAAVTRAAADAPRLEVTASKGTVEVDVGPTTLVAESGAGRAGGGGQPELREGAVRQPLERTPQQSAPLPALLADEQGAVVAAPVGVGGAAAHASDLDVEAESVVDARPAAAPMPPGGPVARSGGDELIASLSLTPAARRASDVTDQVSEAGASGIPAPAARKAARNRQLAVEAGAVDLSAGNAADQPDADVPSPSERVVASPLSPSERQPALNPVSSERQPAGGAEEGDATADGPRLTGLSARAEAVDASIGPPAAGGGTAAPPRTARAPTIIAPEHADEPTLAGTPPPETRHSDFDPAAGAETEPETRHSDFGRVAGSRTRHSDFDPAADGTVGGGGRGSGITGISTGIRQSDFDPAAEGSVGGIGRRVPHVGLSEAMAGIATEAAAVAPAADLRPSSGELGLEAGSPRVARTSRPSGPQLAVDIEAPAGVGGLDVDVTVDVGVRSRPTPEPTDQIQLESLRFNRNRVGGQPDFNTAAAMPTESFRRRVARVEGSGVPADATGPQTEEAIELGLVFLSQAQLPDGRWTLDHFSREDGLPQLASDSAATGLALLAFQGAGYTHRNFRYAEVVGRGLEFLLRNQRADGSLFIPMDEESNRVVQFYSHSIAALALCEAYGMTQDSTLREPAQRAIDFIVATQNTQRGGWRYTTGVSSDTSVTGWMMMALRSGELANLQVPAETYRHIGRWLDAAQASKGQPHLYRYNPFASQDSVEQRAGRNPTPTMTSVGLLMRLYLGWRRDNPAMARGAEYLAQFPPAIGTSTRPQRDTYYWYYATQVMFHMGGDYWRQWSQQLHPVLVGAQLREGRMAGSWDPRNPVPDRWGPFAGRLYVTTMNLLSLEVTYRHLPLYEDTAR